MDKVIGMNESTKHVHSDSEVYLKPAQQKVTLFFRFCVFGWIACTSACVVVNTLIMCSYGWRFETLLVAAIFVLFIDLPIIFPVGLSVGLLALLVSWFLNSEGKSKFRRYSLALVLGELAGLMILPAWTSLLERFAEGGPPEMVARSEFFQRLKNEQEEESAQVKHFVDLRSSVSQGVCLMGPAFWATKPGDKSYIDLLKSLKQLHSVQRCIDCSNVPLLIFPYTVLLALWGLDLRRRKAVVLDAKADSDRSHSISKTHTEW